MFSLTWVVNANVYEWVCESGPGGKRVFLMGKPKESREFEGMRDRLAWSRRALPFQGSGYGIQREVLS
jgi:hypothetical protein